MSHNTRCMKNAEVHLPPIQRIVDANEKRRLQNNMGPVLLLSHCLRWTGPNLGNAQQCAFGRRFIEQSAISGVNRGKERVTADIIIIIGHEKMTTTGKLGFSNEAQE
jgi:hypothetical protein